MAIPADRPPVEPKTEHPDAKKETRKSLTASLLGKLYAGPESTAAQSKAHLTSAPSAEVETKRIQALFIKTSVVLHAKKETPEYVRLQLDTLAKKLLQKEKVAANVDLALKVLTGDVNDDFQHLEKMLHELVDPELATLGPHEQKVIRALSFTNILRAKLVELMLEQKHASREEIALLSGLGRTRELGFKLDHATSSDQASLLQELEEIDPVDLDIPTLIEVPVSLENTEVLLTLWTKVIDNLHKQIKSEPSEKQLDLLVQLGRALSHLERLGGGKSLYQKSLVADLEAHCRQKGYLTLTDIAERLQQKVKASDDKPLTKTHFRALLLLESYYEANSKKDLAHITPFEQLLVARFLLESCGSKGMYKRFEATLKETSWLLSPTLSAIYTSITALGLGKEHFAFVSAKLNNAAQVVLNDKRELVERHKLTQEEFGTAFRAHSLWKLLQPLKTLGLLDSDEAIKTFRDDLELMSASYSDFEEALLAEIKAANTFKNGDILTKRLKAQQALESKGVKAEEWMMKQFITESSHSASLFVTKDGALMVSHVLQSHLREPLSLAMLFSSDGWHLLAHKLLKNDSEPIKWLTEMFQAQKTPCSLEAGVNAAYHEGTRHFHEDLGDNFANIINSQERQLAAGVADIKPWGHTKSKPRESFVGLHAQFSRAMPSDKEMICSEFVTKATIVSLIEADFKLVEALKEWIAKSVKPEAEAKRRLELLDSRQKQNGLVFLDIPFSTKERLKRVHPGRLIELLTKRDCIDAIKPPPLLAKFVQT